MPFLFKKKTKIIIKLIENDTETQSNMKQENQIQYLLVNQDQ